MPNYKNHLSQGFSELLFKSKKVVSSLNSDSFAVNLARLNLLPASVGIIPPGYEPDSGLACSLDEQYIRSF